MKKIIALLVLVLLVGFASQSVVYGLAEEVGPSPVPPDHEWTYVLVDLDEDGEEDKLGFLSRDYHIFGSLHRPSLPGGDTPPYHSGDYVGLYFPQYTITSREDGNDKVLLHYHITDKHSPDSVSPGGGEIETTWSNDQVTLTRTANLNTERCLMTFSIRNVGTEPLSNVHFIESHGFDDYQYIFDGDDYPGGQLMGENNFWTRHYPIFGMVYAPVPDTLEIPAYSEAAFDLGDLLPGESREVLLSIVWSTSSDPNLAKEQVVAKMVRQKEILRGVPTTIDCDPNTLNLKSKGKWVTCYIEIDPQEEYVFLVEQGGWAQVVMPISTPEDSATFYDWWPASSHTGYEEPYVSKIYMHKNTLTGSVSLIIHHNIHRQTSGIITGYGRVDFDLEGVPSGAFVSQSDDPRDGWDPPRTQEFSLSYPDMEGHWEYIDNTDGGALDGLPSDEEWSIGVDPLYWENIDKWEFLSGDGVSYDLDMGLPMRVSYVNVSYSVREIDAATILLNGLLSPELDPKYGFVRSESSYIMDHDGDGIEERMVKFARSQVQGILEVGDSVELTITGELVDGTPFWGSDSIRVIEEP